VKTVNRLIDNEINSGTLMEIVGANQDGMKEAPIIPMMKINDALLPFKMHAISGIGEDDLPHSHDYYEITWITKGAGKLCADLKEYTLDENTVYFIRPNQVHQLFLSSDAEGFIISFNDSFLNLGAHEFDMTSHIGLFQLFSNLQVLTFQDEIITDVREIVTKMMREFENDYSFKVQLLKRYLKIFLIHVSRQLERGVQTAEQSRENDLIKRFMELLEKKFKEKKMVADYAAELSITPNYLNGIIKKVTGFCAGYHIRQRVVLEAKRLGRYSDAGMKEIAYSLGFEDSSHFSKFFKAVAGMNFSDFKKGGLIYPLYPQQELTA
jgi:YesN/AraC family two-component response regulator